MLLNLVLISSLVGLSVEYAIGKRACGQVWTQCGGLEFTGETCCAAGNKCVKQSDYYSQCQPDPAASVGPGGSNPQYTPTGPVAYTTTIPVSTTSHAQSPYPTPTGSGNGCGSWQMTEGVCCPSYSKNDNRSESCSGSGDCITPPAAMCKSGNMYPEVHSVSTDEKWHYSRSTHFGLTSGGACGYGLYGLCTKGSKTSSWTDPMLGSTCDAFCKAYPTLCKDPSSTTLRGNFAAPNGDYYTQFWPSLPGDLDNYLSCGECYELIHTHADGSDYAVGEAGYTEPITLEIVDSCPCSANSKWCCGPGADHCGEINFKYGCPLPSDSIHLDLSDIAMGRLQGNGSMNDGVIPTRYRRVRCPKPGNIYLWMREGGSQYYFALTAVNAAGIGSITNIEVKGASGITTWTSLVRDPHYTSSRPQERYGAWTIPQNTGPYDLPIAVRLTSAAGEQVVSEMAIKSFTPPKDAVQGFWYLDTGVQFSM
ncbi:Non-catalytic module family expansin [Clohesyomyces aquaticus]|uniref:Non-catalytic module family expansin n=1 Tax=Clohesyomyces aquaticus TaxID=1231657 RepID=A0A1Y1ZF84_9PLEO|nr:Non-catalytic module family expansin [Clohesyomyces aquaticus]